MLLTKRTHATNSARGKKKEPKLKTQDPIWNLLFGSWDLKKAISKNKK
jgi:hypothetical protein